MCRLFRKTNTLWSRQAFKRFIQKIIVEFDFESGSWKLTIRRRVENTIVTEFRASGGSSEKELKERMAFDAVVTLFNTGVAQFLNKQKAEQQ